MVTVYLNDKEIRVAKDSSLLEFLQAREVPRQPYAIAVNATFVPRGLYADTRLAEGDRIELVVATQGG